MITPRVTRLVRTPSLYAFQQAIRSACRGSAGVQRTLVVVPTRTAARRLLCTLEETPLPGEDAARELPDVLTRSQMYEALGAALRPSPRWLSPFERDVILEAAAHEAVTEGMGPPFNLRPALVREMLALYDELRRHGQTVADFERLLVAELEPRAPTDRGAERVLRQTRFLAAAFRSYERQVAGDRALDEHVLRALLLAEETASPWQRAIVTTGDWAAERDGLWPADFDLLTRLAGICEIVVVATEARLAAGLHVRIRDLLPGIEETKVVEPDGPPRQPQLIVPVDDVAHFTSRDREAELLHVVRRIRQACGDRMRLDRTAVVFARPLPYLYLARDVCASARMPFQCDDSLPLAAEPAAAALDVVLTFVSSGASRQATVELLRSPHFELSGEFTAADWHDAVHALDASLGEVGYLGDPEHLRSLSDQWRRAEPGTGRRAQELERRAAPAAAAAVAAAGLLEPLFGTASAVTQLSALRRFLESHHRSAPPDASSERDRRARHAIFAILDGLIAAYGRRTELPWTVDLLSATLRRWIEAQTFEPRTGEEGLHFIDAIAARYGSFDDVHLVGLVEGEWPERQRRNIFYSPFLLKQLGWADEGSRSASERADFLDLLRLARRRLSASTFQLEEDTLVEASPLLDELPLAGLETKADDTTAEDVFIDEALLRGALPELGLGDEAQQWLSLRAARTGFAGPAFHGTALPDRRAEYGVSSIEVYEQCPFKYFARHVLQLREEIEEDEGLSPRDRGIFVHEVLRAFYDRWQAAGRGAITPESLDEAHGVLLEVAEPMLAHLGAVDAALERARLLGSAVAPGVADLVFRMEAERATAVVSRRLEERFGGTFELKTAEGVKSLPVRGIADRIDLLADGSLRVLDYKASVPPAALQLAIYAITSVQRLEAEQGRRWTVGEAAYVVYGGGRAVKPLGRTRGEIERALDEAQARFVAAVTAIESGSFPPRPAHPRLCTYCAYAAVCRKDYVAEADQLDATTSV